MLKGSGPYGIDRRPERIVEFTDEFVKTLPEPASYADVFWDTECKDLTVMKGKRGVLYRMKLGNPEKRILGINVSTTLVRLGRGISVAEARAKYRRLEDAIANKQRLFAGDIDKETVDQSDVDALLDDSVGGERGYETLMSVLMDAYAQAANGKGSERHSNGLTQPFERQDMVKIIKATSIDFAVGQALKKLLEARRIDNPKARRNELLGAIVYAAGAVVALDLTAETPKEDAETEEAA